MYTHEVASWLNYHFANEFLDFGGNTSGLGKQWNITSCSLFNIDSVEPHDYVVCANILEHITRKNQHNIMMELVRLTQKNIFIIVDTAVTQIYEDDYNQMELDKPCRWAHWIGQFFDIKSIEQIKDTEILMYQATAYDFEIVKTTPRKLR